jgi:DMSO/TMAO reductase YedYZ heme-binding membrane subunit
MIAEQFWWHVSRATGMVSWAILTLSILWGLALSTKLLGKRTPPAWLLNLHRFLGGFGVLLVGLHLIALVPDNYIYFGWSELFVPFASPWKTGAITWGIVAFYLLIAVEVTSLAMKRLPRKLWRYVHFSSFVLWLVATVHAITAGTDATHPAFRWSAIAGVQLVLFFTIARILTARRLKRALKAANRPGPGETARPVNRIPRSSREPSAGATPTPARTTPEPAGVTTSR